jgi:hypothetical protein
MQQRWLSVVAAIVTAGIGLGSIAVAGADDDHRTVRLLRARLTGFQEVFAGGGGVSTPAQGTFRAQLDEATGLITYTLRYSGFVSPVTQSHLHFGQHHTSGGISVWLCQTATNPAPAPAPGAQPVPMCAEEVSGEALAANVIGPAGQGIAPGEFAELVAAIKAGTVYVNVHSSLFPAGEIRGQLF